MSGKIEIVNSNIDVIFANTSDNDMVIYPGTSNQNVHIGVVTGGGVEQHGQDYT